jgi:hypothetical protein
MLTENLMIRILLTILVFLIATPAFAFDLPANVPNGCGTSDWGAVVPDKSFITRCRFKEACDQHDVCYGRCLPGGTLFGQSTCADQKARSERRIGCDSALYSDIASLNEDRIICRAYGSLYRWAVIRFGEDAFHGASSALQQIDKLNDFQAYMDSNPAAFTADELKAAFDLLASKPAQAGYLIEFDSVEPRLLIHAFKPGGGMVTELDLRGQKP